MRLPDKYKILMLIPELGYGGAEQSFIKLANLLAHKHNVSIVVFKKHYENSNYTKSTIDTDLPIISLDQKQQNKFKRWQTRLSKLKNLKKECDICISFLTGSNILNVFARANCKTIVSMRGSRHFDPGINAIKKLIYKYLIDPITFTLADKTISVSDGLTYELGKILLSKSKRKLQTIEVFVKADELIKKADDPIENDLEVMNNYPTIVVVGRLSKEKGFQNLIPVFASVTLRIKQAKLMIIGDGPLLNEIENICRDHNLSFTHDIANVKDHQVLFLGYKENPIRYFKIADLFVLSSLTEGFPNGVIEALASGIKVLAVDCPWGAHSILSKSTRLKHIPYQTIDENNVTYGTLMPRLDQIQYHDIWIDTIQKNLTNPQNSEYDKNLRKSRVRELDIENIGKKWLDLMDQIVDK